MSAWSRHLYLRIWLAVVLGVALLMALVGWFWHLSMEQNMANPPVREWVVRNAQGEILGSTTARMAPGVPLEIQLPMAGGGSVPLYLERRVERPGAGMNAGMNAGKDASLHDVGRGAAVVSSGRGPYARNPSPWWARPPYGFVGMLALMGLGAALALYPVVRRLTRRLQDLQQGVQRFGEGDLTVRVPEVGEDEVADLSRRFNAAAERIGQLVQAQKSLLANASHELRSPLARIRMGLELLDNPQASDAVRERSRGEILRNMAELEQLIDEILLASRLDAREADIGSFETVDLVGLCAEECARVGARLEVPEGLSHLPVQGVARLLRRMVRNLLENGLRYGRPASLAGVGPAPALAVQTEKADAREEAVVLRLQSPAQEGVMLRVCDRGPGVPAAYRARIFEPFFRLPGASEGAGGVGLGLALVRSIAERHGWGVRCEARPGGGACFVVTVHPSA